MAGKQEYGGDEVGNCLGPIRQRGLILTVSCPEIEESIRKDSRALTLPSLDESPHNDDGERKDEEHPQEPSTGYKCHVDVLKELKKDIAFHCLIVFSSPAKITISR